MRTKEESREYMREYREKNRERVRAYCKEYYQRNKERRHEYYEAHKNDPGFKERNRKAYKKWYANHREEACELQRYYYRIKCMKKLGAEREGQI